ncbi:hypothetical protein A1A1_02677 [Planococcus antarcticus DSM 14505]|uniref:Uncharacterized protein n=1 Tax=Planococcus antarcticus DSM 14505 TaxID=1185653 RepID=A0AA87LTE0_9BACL|nr:DUF6731 family protein [Planococcus antarcticus]EIM07961.1 hypothetical protein A1A1_02677 [Planococcus antarcticus DSM 14505]
MARKYIRFNYFTTNLVPLGLPEEMGERYFAAAWDMTEILDYISIPRNTLDGVINVGEYIAELDRDTFIYDRQNNLYSFQISKLRETNIPSIKSIGNPKVDLTLSPDEYIGEFVTIVYDPTYYTLSIQSNLYSLNADQVMYFLNELRWRYLAEVGEQEQLPLKVALNPIIDPGRIDMAQTADIYRKITIKGSDISAEALAQNGTLNEVSELIGRAQGINFELTLSIGQAPKEESLDNDTIQEIIEGFRNIHILEPELFTLGRSSGNLAEIH